MASRGVPTLEHLRTLARRLIARSNASLEAKVVPAAPRIFGRYVYKVVADPPSFQECSYGLSDCGHKGLVAATYPRLIGVHTRALPGLPMSLSSSSAILEKQFKCREHQIGVRGFAKAVQMPQSMQKPMKLKLYMGSPGVIGDPYKPPPKPLPLIRRWFTKEGWARRKEAFMGMIKTSYTIAKLRQKTKGYSQQRFYQEVSDLYKQINSMSAEGDRTNLRHLVTDSVFSTMKNQLKNRESSLWSKVHWEMVGPISKMRTVQGRLIGVDKNNQDNAFVQLTVKINSKQKFAAYDKRGKVVAGDPEKEFFVEDFWVFEKPLLLTEAKWRLCGRLSG